MKNSRIEQGHLQIPLVTVTAKQLCNSMNVLTDKESRQQDSSEWNSEHHKTSGMENLR